MRRIRTGVMSLNGHGHYVCYIIDYQRQVGMRSALLITSGPGQKAWWFDPLPIDLRRVK